ncbi:Pituitary tumor-transforming gene 1 protein-interacting protein [Triplophysa tibetana]|uniref:Pituitary tumor-transforming gene 1 protein-interacting protein n=1 Tax=Triplophysa tibetana TaxID=1572043 RepID=A0A5A9MZU6_9TELE|nr:Pituitary tumor-transforming gene 1 protein-interacting protein [Triplophysa tibetana]
MFFILITACNTLTSCDSCLTNVSTNNTCTDYPVAYLIPPNSVCKLSQARWGVCWVFESNKNDVMCDVRVDRDEEQYARRREEITQRADDRRAERRTKHDQIRKKYGLIPDSDHPYSKFENE